MTTGSVTHDNYKRLEGAQYEGLRKCPCCGEPAALWQYSKGPDLPTQKLVMCDGEKPIIEAPNEIVEPLCPLYLPPDCFYQATAREAIKFWVAYSEALEGRRRRNNWQEHRAGVLRDTDLGGVA